MIIYIVNVSDLLKEIEDSNDNTVGFIELVSGRWEVSDGQGDIFSKHQNLSNAMIAAIQYYKKV